MGRLATCVQTIEFLILLHVLLPAKQRRCVHSMVMWCDRKRGLGQSAYKPQVFAGHGLVDDPAWTEKSDFTMQLALPTLQMCK